MDDYSPYPKGQLSMELAAAALGMQSMPLSSYHTLAGLDAFTPASYQSTRHSIGAYPPSAFQYPHDPQPDSYLPSALSGSNLALHDALTNVFLAAQLQQQQRPPSPPLHYPLRWPEADGYPQYPMQHQMDPTLAQGPSMFPASYSVAPQSLGTYQTAQDAHDAAAQPAWSVSGSLDPVTGVFQRMPEHPRLRTAQACEKCRTRKAKCSGEHPSCQRCRSRGLLCEYAPERRMRGPNKKKREGHSAGRGSPASTDQRRGSIVSTASTGSATSDHLDAYRFPAVPVSPAVALSRPVSRASLPRYASPHPHPPSPSRPHDVPARAPPSSPLRYSVPEGPSAPEPSRRPRPPPLHLGAAAFFDASAFLHRAPGTPAPAPADDCTATPYAARRQSLPAYLLHGFAPTPPPAGFAPPHSDCSHSRSTSASEAPLTPEGARDPSADLAYADDLGFGYEGRTLGDIHGSKEAFELGLPDMHDFPDASVDGDTFVGVTVLDVSPVPTQASDV